MAGQHAGNLPPPEKLVSWLIERGLAAASQEALLQGYCSKLTDFGLPVHCVHVAQKALHPVYGGIGFDWQRNESVWQEQYEHTTQIREQWVRSPFYYLLKSGQTELRERLCEAPTPNRFPFLDELRSRGATDYFAVVVPFGSGQPGASKDPYNPPEGFIISWTSDRENGFSDAEIAFLKETLPALGLALKAAANHQMAESLLAIYLGYDAGRRVLSGRIQRGTLETIQSAILYFDLQSFTRLAEVNSPAAEITMLNDYFGQIVPIIDRHDGNVLKFMGDGLLAIFNSSDHQVACSSAVNAAREIRNAVNEINTTREIENQCWTGFRLAVHEGNVEYGNIGADSRLDFRVIGSAVNTTARIQGMCRSLEQDLIVSGSVARQVQCERTDLISLGRYMMRGVPHPQELFTIVSQPD